LWDPSRIAARSCDRIISGGRHGSTIALWARVAQVPRNLGLKEAFAEDSGARSPPTLPRSLEPTPRTCPQSRA
jgi:hypothetical protein